MSRGPIINKLHIMYKRTGILGSIFEEDNCDKFIAEKTKFLVCIFAYSKN